MKLNGEGTLENPIELGAEGVRPLWPNLSGKRTETESHFCVSSAFFGVAAKAALYFFEGEKRK